MNNYNEERQIKWHPPELRRGLARYWDKFVGPGAKRSELWIQFVPVVLAGLAVPLYASIKGLGWTVPQFIIATLLTMDMVGGAITNATNTAKRWYHREGQGFQQHFLFISIHATQLLLVAWFFCRSHWWSFFGILYGYLLVTAFVILSVPALPTASSRHSVLRGEHSDKLLRNRPNSGFRMVCACLFLEIANQSFIGRSSIRLN